MEFKNITTEYSAQYYYRLKSQDKRSKKEEMLNLTSKYQQDKLEFIKNSVIAEFLGISSTQQEIRKNTTQSRCFVIGAIK